MFTDIYRQMYNIFLDIHFVITYLRLLFATPCVGNCPFVPSVCDYTYSSLYPIGPGYGGAHHLPAPSVFLAGAAIPHKGSPCSGQRRQLVRVVLYAAVNSAAC